MSIMEAVEHVFRNYAVLEGRARRSEFWHFQLFRCIELTMMGLLVFTGIGAILMPIYSIGTLIPNLAHRQPGQLGGKSI